MFVSEGDPIMVRTPPGAGPDTGKGFRAFDKEAGDVVWEPTFPAGKRRLADHLTCTGGSSTSCCPSARWTLPVCDVPRCSLKLRVDDSTRNY